MCGIAGIVSSHEQHRSLIRAMNHSMQHRGPDNSSFYAHENLALAHNRLSLLDLSDAGNQPFTDDRFVLIYNGEIYNYLALKADLAAYAIPYKSGTDTEVLFYCLKYWGMQRTLATLKGMYAFAWYDTLEKTVTIARDRLGIKPLYFYHHNHSFSFASELKAILAAQPDIGINEHHLYEAAFGNLEFSRRITAFKHVHQLEPGYYATYSVENDNLLLTQYFDIADLIEENYYQTLHKKQAGEVLEEFNSILQSSVAGMLQSDAHMGSFVSGGVDSSLVTAVAVKQKELNLYTANVIGGISEYEDAKSLAQALQMELYAADFAPDMFLEDWVKTTWYYESPIVVHTNAVPFQRVSQLARMHKDKAVITGEGSDELFLGYPGFLTRRYDNMLKWPMKTVTGLYKKIPRLAKYVNLSNASYRDQVVQLSRNFEGELEKQLVADKFSFIKDAKELRFQMLTPEALRSHLPSLLWRNDRMGMMHSIESRFPFLDEDMLRFGVNLPVKFKIERTSTFNDWKHPFLLNKAIVRKSAEQLLPHALAYKRKQGFPMYGHQFITVHPAFFHGGFLQEIWDLKVEAINHFCKTSDPYLVAKLVSLDIWGSLFISKQLQQDVHARLRTHVTMKMKQ